MQEAVDDSVTQPIWNISIEPRLKIEPGTRLRSIVLTFTKRDQQIKLCSELLISLFFQVFFRKL